MTQKEIDNFDPNTFDWKNYSWKVAEFCPQHFNPNKFDWENYSWKIANFCPQHMDKKLYDWKYHSWAVVEYCPQHMDKEFISLENVYNNLPEYNWKTYEQIKALAIGKLL